MHTDSIQETFNPIRYSFHWVNDWYTFNYDEARKLALAARRKRAKELRGAGWTVRTFTLRNQYMTLGGIGTGHPEITQVVSVFVINASK